jgi:23S rRNA (pseudouridine1915-N3)-methyltransferase
LRFRLVKVTKANKSFDPIVQDYQKRLKGFGSFESIFLKNEKEKNQYLLSIASDPHHFLLVFDERGVQGNTHDFKDLIISLIEDRRYKTMTFLVGGPFGLEAKDREQAHQVWSFSNMVLAGDIAWAVLWEQVYRVFSLIAGSPYHHD